MGLDASVMCNCYKEGRTSIPPVPIELIYFDDKQYHLALNLPWEWEGNEDKYFLFDNLFDNWMENACEHEGMNYACVWVSNWSGYRTFQQALGQVGWQHFPTLKAELPNANGGLMSAISAVKALQELNYFKHHADLVTNIFLVNSETGTEIHNYVAAYEGIFIWDGKCRINLGVDEQGFFIMSMSDPPRELFRSLRFEQRLLESQLTAPYLQGRAEYQGKVEYVDFESGQSFVCNSAIGDFQYPRYMHIEQRRLDASNFSYIINPLTEIFQAALETGNPVRWC